MINALYLVIKINVREKKLIGFITDFAYKDVEKRFFHNKGIICCFIFKLSSSLYFLTAFIHQFVTDFNSNPQKFSTADRYI